MTKRKFARAFPRTTFWSSLCLALGFVVAAASASAATPPQKALSPEARAEALVAQMTLEEKAAQMQDNAPAIPRLGLKRYGWWNEVLHGVARAGHATVYPQAVGLAATWDAPLMRDIGDAISVEGRASHNAALTRDPTGTSRYFGVNYWSPNINIFRDPRWGRGQETYGEDPYLTGHLAVAFIQGIQGPDPLHYKGIATPKHFVVHSGPEPLRHGFNVDVSAFDFEDTYTPAFRAAIVDGKANSLMCAYNAIDGFPACASPLLQTRLRSDWGFKGFVVTDCDSIDDMVKGHKSHPDAASASAAAVKAGADLDCGGTYKALPSAVQQGLITSADLDVAVARLMAARIRMGLLDKSAYDAIPASEINSKAHRALALRAADEAIVLLSNPRGLLPLKGSERIAVIGPNADLLQSVEGNYTGAPLNPVLPLAALRAAFGAQNVSYAPGAPLVEGMRMPVPETFLRPAAGSTERGLTGAYFDNTTFEGTPKLTRLDPVINFDFYRTAPEGFKPLGFAVRWTGVLTPPVAGTYQLGFRMASPRPGQPGPSVKIWVDDTLVVTPELSQSAAVDQAYCGGACAKPPMATTSVRFADTLPHTVRIDYARTADDRAISLDWIAPTPSLIDGAVAAAKESDVVLAFVGLSPDLEGEEMAVNFPGFAGGDRTSLGLPQAQKQMLEAVKATGKKLVVVYLTGGAISDPWVEANADAVLHAWYPGEAGGEAIARVLTGKVNPAGRLPYTVYRDMADLPAFEDYSMTNRTYRYFKGPVIYPFGHGLSYTTFSYGKAHLSASVIKAGRPITATVVVKNTGRRDGDEVVQLYVAKPGDRANPVLAGFSRVHVKAGDSKAVNLTLDARALSKVDAKGLRQVETGTYTLSFGGGQPAFVKAQSVKLEVKGTYRLPK